MSGIAWMGLRARAYKINLTRIFLRVASSTTKSQQLDRSFSNIRNQCMRRWASTSASVNVGYMSQQTTAMVEHFVDSKFIHIPKFLLQLVTMLYFNKNQQADCYALVQCTFFKCITWVQVKCIFTFLGQVQGKTIVFRIQGLDSPSCIFIDQVFYFTFINLYEMTYQQERIEELKECDLLNSCMSLILRIHMDFMKWVIQVLDFHQSKSLDVVNLFQGIWSYFFLNPRLGSRKSKLISADFILTLLHSQQDFTSNLEKFQATFDLRETNFV